MPARTMTYELCARAALTALKRMKNPTMIVVPIRLGGLFERPEQNMRLRARCISRTIEAGYEVFDQTSFPIEKLRDTWHAGGYMRPCQPMLDQFYLPIIAYGGIFRVFYARTPKDSYELEWQKQCAVEHGVTIAPIPETIWRRSIQDCQGWARTRRGVL